MANEPQTTSYAAYLVTAAIALASAIYGWATWTLRSWVHEAIRLALEEERKRQDELWVERKRDVDSRYAECNRTFDKKLDLLEGQSAGAAAALEERTRRHDEQIARNRERYLLLRNDHENIVRDLYRLRQKVEGGIAEVWPRPRESDDDAT